MSTETRPHQGWRTARIVLLFAPILVLMAWYARATYWQCDDAFISFRYVWHWVQGHGLVFNVDERVEGYTNFMWVVELATIWKLFGVPPEVACDWLSIACTIGALVCIVFLARNGPWTERRLFVTFGTLLLLATSRTWAVWSSSGLETRQFTLFTLLGILLVSRGLGNPRRLIAASLAFVAAEYTRPEGPLLWAFAGVWLLMEMAIQRRFSVRDVLAYGVPCVVLVGAHYLWRHAYYGDWFPNTYYAKFVRPWPEAGLRYYAAAAIESGAWMMMPFAVVGAIARARRGDRTHLLGLFVVGAHVIYLVRIGGDHFEMRPLDFYWPLLFIATVDGILEVARRCEPWLDRLRARLKPRLRADMGLLFASVLLAITIVYGFAVQEAKRQFTMPFETRAASHFLIVHLDRGNSPWLFALPGMSLLMPAYNDVQDYALHHGVGTVWREHEVFWRDEMRNWQPYEIARGKHVLPPDSVTARGSIGVSGYYLAELELVDQKGLTDRHVAHTGDDIPQERRYMAHDRFAQPDYIFERGFNVYIEPAARKRHDALLAAPFALQISDDVWMPFSSRKPDWVDTAFVGRPLWKWKTAAEIGCFRDGAVDGWTLEGDAFAAGVRRDVPMTRTIQWFARCPNDHGLLSRDPTEGGVGTGTARSQLFRVPESAALEMRVWGSASDKTGVRVIGPQGETIADFHPHETGSTVNQRVDLSEWAGREVRVELYDGSDDTWVGALGIVLLEPELLADH